MEPTPNALALMNENTNDNALANVQSTSKQFLLSMSVAYGTSKCVVETKLARPGDFVLGGKICLGDTVECVYLEYRLRASVWNKGSNSYEDEVMYHGSRQGPVSTNAAWQEFVTKPRDSEIDLQIGTEVLFFLPQHNAFAAMFFKKTAASAAEMVIRAGKGRVCQLKTSFHKGKKFNWYDILVAPLSKKIAGVDLLVPGITFEDIVPPIDALNQAFKQFYDTTQKIIDEAANPDVARPSR
jgi:hypothetical protein